MNQELQTQASCGQRASARSCFVVENTMSFDERIAAP